MTREFAEARRSDLGLVLASGSAGDAISGYRQQAFELFEKHGLPDRRIENWKYTSLDSLLRSKFTPAPVIESFDRKENALPTLDAMRVVINNGNIDTSGFDQLRENGLQVELLTDAAAHDSNLLDQYLAGMQGPALAPYNLNTALMHNALFVQVEAGRSVQKPLLLHFTSSQANSAVASYPRVIVKLEENSSLTLVEYHESQNTLEHLCTQVNQFDLKRNSVLIHHGLQHGAPTDLHLCRTEVHVAESASFSHHGMQFGGKLLRNEIDVVLAGKGSKTDLNGLFVPTGKQHMDNRISIIHAAPETISSQNYRGVLNDQGRGVFNGKVLVEKAAQKTDATQSNRNLLLSNRAEIDTKPELEIYADDVKCSHGVATGQLDKNQLFYLLSRGIEAQTAQSLLVFAFADSVITTVDIPEIRKHLEQCLVGELPDANRIRDFV